MQIHKFRNEVGEERYILLDEDEMVVKLPSLFALSLAKQFRFSKRTVLEYLKILKLFCKDLHCLGTRHHVTTIDEDLATMGASVVEDWFVKLRDQKLSSVTLRTRDVVLKRFMEWLTTYEAGLIRSILDHPYSDGCLKTVTPKRPAPKFLTYKEIGNFIRDGFYNEHERCLLHFMFDTGIRVSEVPRVLQSDLPDPTAYPVGTMYFPLLVRGSKGRGDCIRERITIISLPMLERLFRLHNNWRKYLQAQTQYPPDQMPAFLNVQGKPITAMVIQKQMYTAAKRLRKAGLFIKRVTPHVLRHSTAFSVLQSEFGRDYFEKQVACQHILGHQSIRSTDDYTRIPAAMIVQLQQYNIGGEIQPRFAEAEYICEYSFKPQRDHTERRGHGPSSSYSLK